MEINNLELVKPFLKFDSENDFYYLQILQRKKENPQLGSNSRVIKNYYITSAEYLESHYHEIMELCKHFNARAMLRLNRRCYEKTAYKAMINIANSMGNKEFSFIKKSYDRAVGSGNAEPKETKSWILDWDGEFDKFDKSEIEIILNNSRPEGNKVLAYIPSKSGVHIIVKPFDSRDLVGYYPDMDICKNNPTNLFIPE